MPAPADISQLIATLPDSLFWLDETLVELARPAAFMVQDSKAIAPVGGTFTRGEPDVPMGQSWPHWNQAPQDGPSVWLQLNLEDIPTQVRQRHWPQVGVVWLFLDLSGESWGADVYFDPRPAGQIPWKPRRLGAEPPTVVRWELRTTLPDATDETLPEISQDWRSPDGLRHQYAD